MGIRCNAVTSQKLYHFTIVCLAHTTQFVQPGYYYLKHDYGSGGLEHGGSYVTFVNKDNMSDFTIVIETMV